MPENYTTKPVYDKSGTGTGDERIATEDTAARTGYAASGADIPGGESNVRSTPALSGGQSYIDSATSTVSGQLDKILSQDSALMSRARNMSKAQSAATGLMGSSMAQGAAMGAMVDRALPIAQQDAATFAKSDLMDKQQQQSFETLDKQFNINKDITRINQQFEELMQNQKFSQDQKIVMMNSAQSLFGEMLSSFTSAKTAADYTSAEYENDMDNFNNAMGSLFAIWDTNLAWG